VRSDEPGRTFNLTADRIGSLDTGSPVLYRDINVGEVLGYSLTHDGRQSTIEVFVHQPYDAYVHQGSHFWNVSGASLDLDAGGAHLRIGSLRSALLGGVAFDTESDALSTPQAEDGTSFPLYGDEATAHDAGYRERIPVMTYIEGSVRGLSVGAPVEVDGIPVGNVTDVRLQFRTPSEPLRVAVQMQLQPERLQATAPPSPEVVEAIRNLVRRGLRAQLRTASYLTGQLVVALDFFPNAAPATLSEQNGIVVIPSVPGSLDSLTQGITSIVQRLNQLPFEQIGNNLNATLAATNALANSAELRDSLKGLADAVQNTRDLVNKLNAGMTPALQRVPEIAQSLQTTLDRTNKLAASADAAYGEGSDFKRDLARLMSQVSDAARSVHLLADYLDQHPSALLRGRGGNGD
jgi:paraquat-inducible protein B